MNFFYVFILYFIIIFWLFLFRLDLNRIEWNSWKFSCTWFNYYYRNIQKFHLLFLCFILYLTFHMIGSGNSLEHDPPTCLFYFVKRDQKNTACGFPQNNRTFHFLIIQTPSHEKQRKWGSCKGIQPTKHIVHLLLVEEKGVKNKEEGPEILLLNIIIRILDQVFQITKWVFQWKNMHLTKILKSWLNVERPEK